MNPIYVVLGYFLWKLWGKKVLLWYNHPMGNLMAKIGISLSDKIFYTSPYSFSAKYKHAKIMPVGIDTSLFKLDSSIDKKPNRVISLGRISPIKKIEVLIEAAKTLDNNGIDLELLIIGSPASELDRDYLVHLKDISSELISKNKIIFRPSVPNYEAYKLYNSGSIFVNSTPTGSFDKSILEAMACELLVLVSNKTLANIFSDKIRNICLFKEDDSQDLSEKFIALFSLGPEDIKEVKQYGRELVVKDHSLDKLMQDLASIFNTI
jgi:glycosyltransferase involved in cell wall biosynthesis